MKINRRWCLMVSVWILITAYASAQTLGSAQSPHAKRINLNVTFSCNGHPCPSTLEPQDFAVSFNKQTQTINNFSDPSVPMSIAFVLDLTGSMKNHDLYRKPEFLKDTLGAFLNELKQPNEYSLTVFGKEIQTMQDWTPNAKTIWRALEKLPEPSGSVGFHEACVSAIERLEKRSNEKRVLVLITDDDQSLLSAKEQENFQRKIQDSQVVVFGIYVRYPFGRFDSTFPGDVKVQAEIDSFSIASGGLSWYPRKKDDLPTELFRIASNLNCFYLIGFTPLADLQTGKKYPINVTAKLPPDTLRGPNAITLHYRKSYLASGIH